MAFIGSMFSNSNGAGFDATANQAPATQLTQGGIDLSNAQAGSNGGQTITSQPGLNGTTQMVGPSGIAQESQAAASGLAATNAQLQQQQKNGSALAQSQLTQATGQNIQNAAGMVSSQKGLNGALAARQASENATSANQQAGNQSAQLQAQTQMSANQQLSSNLLGQQGIYQGALANQNNTQAAIAAGNQANQAQALGGVTGGFGQAAFPSLAKGGMVRKRYDDGGMVSPTADVMPNPPADLPNPTEATSAIAGASGPTIASGTKAAGAEPNGATGVTNDGAPSKSGGSSGGGLSSMMGLLALLADGGSVPPPATGADGSALMANPTPMPANTTSASGPKSNMAKMLKGMMTSQKPSSQSQMSPKQSGFANIGAAAARGISSLFGGNDFNAQGEPSQAPQGADAQFTNPTPEPAMAKGGKVPALVSPGERYLPPSEAKKVVEGKKSAMKAGEKIPGKPKVAGAKNSYANDTVPKTLQEGGIVIPRSVTQGKDAQSQAHKFVAAHFAQGRRGSLPGKKAKK